LSGLAKPDSAGLNISSLSLAFGGLKALTNVSFSVAPGSITAVIGPNGAGKTSLFNCISGFYRPSTGAIEFGGENISRLHPPARAKIGLARTFQNIALFRGMTVLDNIKLGRHAHMHTNVFDALWYFGRAKREELELRSEIERRVLDFLEMEHIRDQPVASLSYGLRKRVELARALAMRPRILMLDEPVAGMNREETEDMARFILDVKEEWGVTILMVEHDMGLVMDISDHVVVLNFGQVIAAGKPVEIQNNPDVIAAYLGSGDVGDLSRRIAGERAA
jgi:branched-chain amino acid transport system ATP-binding protein